MKERIFDIWLYQEVFNSLPEVKVHRIERRQRGKIDYTIRDITRIYRRPSEFRKLWESRTTPLKAWNELSKTINLTDRIQEGRLLVTRCYAGVMFPPNFLKFLADVFRIQTPIEDLVERVPSFNPLYLFSFFTDVTGTCIYGSVELKDVESELKNSETACQTSPEGEARITPVFIHPLWSYLGSILQNSSLPKWNSLLQRIEEAKEIFLEEFRKTGGKIDEFVFENWVVDTSFLMKYSSLNFNPFIVLKGVVEADTSVPFRLHISSKVIEELEGLKGSSVDEKAERAKKGLYYLHELRCVAPESVVIHDKREDEEAIRDLVEFADFSETDAHCVVITEKMEKQEKNKTILLTTDLTVMNVAKERGVNASNRFSPVKMGITTKAQEKLIREKFEEMYEWFFAALDLEPIRDRIDSHVEKHPSVVLCDALILTKSQFIEMICEEISSIMPSFFLDAIESARKVYFTKNFPLLCTYLDGNANQKLLSEHLRELLDVENLPPATWPKKEGIYPFFNQYVATAAVWKHLFWEGENNLISVNGPPGTGKTTFLKEIVANSVFSLALEVSGLFLDQNQIWIGKPATFPGVHSYYYKGFESLARLGVIVCSANNNAVENVTNELPFEENGLSTKKEVVREVLVEDEETYHLWQRLRKISTVCLGKERESSLNVSASLGKREKTLGFFNALISELNELKKEIGLTPTGECTNPYMAAVYQNAGDKLLESIKEFQKTLKEWNYMKETIKKINSLPQKAEELEAISEKVKEMEQKKEKAWEDFQKTFDKVSRMSDKLRDLRYEIDYGKTFISKMEKRKRELASGFLNKIAIKLKRGNVWKEYNEYCKAIKDHFQKVRTAMDEIVVVKEEKEKLEVQLKAIEDLAKEMESEYSNLLEQKKAIEEEVNDLKSLAEGFLEEFNVPVEINPDYMLSFPDSNEKYISQDFPTHRQKLKPYGVQIIEYVREKVFLRAYKVLMWAFMHHFRSVYTNIRRLKEILENKEITKIDDVAVSGKDKKAMKREIKEAVQSLWGSFFILFPVISTTFHSFANLFSILCEDPEPVLGTLVVDEAGQSMPYMALAPLMISNRAVIVGDPLQLEPVTTISDELLNMIMNTQDLSDEDYVYVSGLYRAVVTSQITLDSSVQVLADRASIYCEEIEQGEGEFIKVGIPLRVHFRCDERIMSISNQIAYNNQMLHFLDEPPQGTVVWIDVKTPPKGGWIKRNASATEIEKAILLVKKIVDKHNPENIFIISPFKNVVNEIKCKKEINRIFGNLVDECIGTVHTFQGKEAPVVIFVLGGQDSQARNWAVRTPSLLNVALTRAKKEIYVIGDVENWSSLRYFNVLAREADIIPEREFYTEDFLL